MTIRTRFAPSPTGFLHVGGVRTALFSWLFARHNKGEFILRIEDTDSERSTKESIEAILQGMQWLGLDYDTGPIYQTNRYSRYNEVLDLLIKENKAYRCYCNKERLDEVRSKQLANKQKPKYDLHCRDLNLNYDKPHVIRFKTPLDGEVVFNDLVYGEIKVKNNELDDLVLRRGDLHPTYNFAVVVDDWDMEISHVIRGDDHINNTPRQINLFKALNAPIPIFAHLPMILGEDGKRLSKRHGAVSVLQFKEEGILPQALLNYLARLGWSYKNEEIFSITDLIDKFNFNNVNRSPASFNYEKLYWLNQVYLKKTIDEATIAALREQYAAEGIICNDVTILKEILALFAERCKTLKEIVKNSKYFFQNKICYDEEAYNKVIDPSIVLPLKNLIQKFSALIDWNKEAIHQSIVEVAKDFNLSMGKIAPSLRIAITGNTVSPSIDITLQLVGKTTTLARLNALVEYIK